MLVPEAYAGGVVAGNDLWMGGANLNAFGDYKNNPVVLQAIREACHRNLYTQLHSNAINGMTKGSRMIYHTPWWQTALTAGQVVSGVVAVLCLGMAVTSFVLPIINRGKRENTDK